MRRGLWRFLAAMLAVICGLGFGFFASIELVRAGAHSPHAMSQQPSSATGVRAGKPAAHLPASLNAHIM